MVAQNSPLEQIHRLRLDGLNRGDLKTICAYVKIAPRDRTNPLKDYTVVPKDADTKHPTERMHDKQPARTPEPGIKVQHLN
jgi:hypothetical protein